MVNEDNPVDSITVDQARKIYTGEITNWQELGGEGYSGCRLGDDMAIDWVENGEYNRVLCFDLVTGELHEIPDEAFYTGHPEWEERPSPIPDAHLQRDSLLGAGAPGLLVKSDYPENGVTVTCYQEDGAPLSRLIGDDLRYCQVDLVDGLVEVLDWNMASYYDLETWECVFRTYLNYEGD